MTTCSIPATNPGASGDSLYGPRICSQPFINWAWDAFDFDSGDWDDGFGYDAVCNNNLPLSRTLSGIWCLTYSAEDYRNESYASNILQWGCRFARGALDELDARCGNGTDDARTWWGLQDNKTELYLGYFYNEPVAARAATLVREARHADGNGHDNGNNDQAGVTTVRGGGMSAGWHGRRGWNADFRGHENAGNSAGE